jgi:hypothetical protein
MNPLFLGGAVNIDRGQIQKAAMLLMFIDPRNNVWRIVF